MANREPSDEELNATNAYFHTTGRAPTRDQLRAYMNSSAWRNRDQGKQWPERNRGSNWPPYKPVETQEEAARAEMAARLYAQGNKNPSGRDISDALHKEVGKAVEALGTSDKLTFDEASELINLALAGANKGEARKINEALRARGFSEEDIKKFRRQSGNFGSSNRKRSAKGSDPWTDGGTVSSSFLGFQRRPRSLPMRERAPIPVAKKRRGWGFPRAHSSLAFE